MTPCEGHAARVDTIRTTRGALIPQPDVAMTSRRGPVSWCGLRYDGRDMGLVAGESVDEDLGLMLTLAQCVVRPVKCWSSFGACGVDG